MSGNKKISQLPNATALTGVELLPIVQNSETRNSVLDDLATYINSLIPATDWALAGNTLTSAGIIGAIAGNFDITIKRNNVTQILFSTASIDVSRELKNYGTGNTGATFAQRWYDSDLALLASLDNNGTFEAPNIKIADSIYLDGDKAINYDSGLGNFNFGSAVWDVFTEGANCINIGYGSFNAITSMSGATNIGAQGLNLATSAVEPVSIGNQGLPNLTSAAYVTGLGSNNGGGHTTGYGSTYLGPYTRTRLGSALGSIAIGYETVITASNQLVIGSNDTPILDVYFGQGNGRYISALPSTYAQVSIHAQGDCQSVADESTAGADLVLRNTRGRGTGVPANFKIQYSPLVASGTTLQTWVDAFIINGTTGVITSAQSTGENILLAGTYQSKSANYTALPTDATIECTSGTFTVTLYTAVGYKGRDLTIKKSTNAGVITVDGNGAETIDGNLTQNINAKNSLILRSNGTNWVIIN